MDAYFSDLGDVNFLDFFFELVVKVLFFFVWLDFFFCKMSWKTEWKTCNEKENKDHGRKGGNADVKLVSNPQGSLCWVKSMIKSQKSKTGVGCIWGMAESEAPHTTDSWFYLCLSYCFFSDSGCLCYTLNLFIVWFPILIVILDYILGSILCHKGKNIGQSG